MQAYFIPSGLEDDVRNFGNVKLQFDSKQS